MRRAQDAQNGMMEYLVISPLEVPCERGESVLSLGLAPLAGTGPAAPEAAISLQKDLQLVYERFNTTYHQVVQLSKAKFASHWEGCYLVCPRLPVLPRVGHALLNALMLGLNLGKVARMVRPGRP